MAFFVNGKSILKSFKRTTNPVTWTDEDGIFHEDYYPFIPKTTTQILSGNQTLNASGAIIIHTHEWYTDSGLKVNDKVEFNGDTYMIVSENDYAGTGYSNVYQYFLNKEMDKSNGVPVVGGDSDW